jgi:tetratricopeptide (TPR) repeat protein
MALAPPRAQAQTDTAACDNDATDADLRIKACSALLERDRTRGAAWGARAWTWLQKKQDYDRAIADFSKAIEYSSDDAPYRGGRGMAHEKKGDFDRALSDLNAAIRLTEQSSETASDPKRAWLYRARASVFEARKNKPGAIADYRKALTLDPQDGNSRTRLARLGAKLEEPQAAIPQTAWNDPRMAPCRAIVVEHLRREFKADKLMPTSTLASIGADSTDIEAVAIQFKDKFGIEIPKDRGVYRKSLLDITRYLYATGKCR